MTRVAAAPAIGAALERVDGPAKVAGRAPYAYEHPVERPAHLRAVQATIARGRVGAVDAAAAEALDGVLAVLTPFNAPRVADTSDSELAVLQSDEVAFRGQFVGAVVAETPEIARHAAELVSVTYQEEPHDVELRADRDDLYAPERVNPNFPTDTTQGDVEAALAAAAVTTDRTYSTATYHNNPMEPHTTVALWTGDGLTLYDSTQGVHTLRSAMAQVLGLDPERIRVVAPYVGGGFGSKGRAHAHVVLAVLAAQVVAGTPVKFPLTRQQMFFVAGYRTPTIQRVRLAAEADGRLTALTMDVVEQTSRIKEFAEQTAQPSRMMYTAPNRRTSHRLAALDVPIPSWMRAPGECPGMFGPEVAMDELALACGLDPIELRIRNEPEVDPELGQALLQSQPGGLPGGGRPPLRLGDARPHSARAGGARVARRHRGRELDLPRRPHALLRDDPLRLRGAVPGRGRRRGHRHGGMDRAGADRRRRPRGAGRRGRCPNRGLRPSPGVGGGRLLGHHVLGVGDRGGRTGLPRRPRRRSRRG